MSKEVCVVSNEFRGMDPEIVISNKAGDPLSMDLISVQGMVVKDQDYLLEPNID